MNSGQVKALFGGTMASLQLSEEFGCLLINIYFPMKNPDNMVIDDIRYRRSLSADYI